MKDHLVRAGTAIAVAVACITAIATPASAAVYSSVLTGGTISLGADTYAVKAAPCNAVPHTMQYDITGGTITALSLETQAVFQVNGGWYHVRVEHDPTVGATAGTYNAPPNRTIANMEVGLIFTIDNAAVATPAGSVCGSNGGAVLCTAGVYVPLSGTYTGNLKGVGDTFDLSGADATWGLQPYPTCNAGPFPAGTGVTITNLTGTVVP